MSPDAVRAGGWALRGRAGWTAAGVALLAVFFAVGALADAFAPAPQGPALSSYATTPSGVAAWAELLQRAGHRVGQLRIPLAKTRLAPGSTLVVLGAGELAPGDVGALESFTGRGGWLVLGGRPGDAARRLIARLPAAGTLTPALGARVPVRRLGAGRILLLGDPSPVENRGLGAGANAALSLALAGPPSRPVAFDESIHGFGSAAGLAAFPARWWVGIVILTLAAVAWATARGRRLGGPDPLPLQDPSPRSAYLDAMAAALVRAGDHDQLGEIARIAGERALKRSPGA